MRPPRFLMYQFSLLRMRIADEPNFGFAARLLERNPDLATFCLKRYAIVWVQPAKVGRRRKIPHSGGSSSKKKNCVFDK